jgi:hypothetical protein
VVTGLLGLSIAASLLFPGKRCIELVEGCKPAQSGITEDVAQQ